MIAKIIQFSIRNRFLVRLPSRTSDDILFIVFEIQWIRFFGVRTKAEKSKGVQDRNERR